MYHKEVTCIRLINTLHNTLQNLFSLGLRHIMNTQMKDTKRVQLHIWNVYWKITWSVHI